MPATVDFPAPMEPVSPTIGLRPVNAARGNVLHAGRCVIATGFAPGHSISRHARTHILDAITLLREIDGFAQ